MVASILCLRPVRWLWLGSQETGGFISENGEAGWRTNTNRSLMGSVWARKGASKATSGGGRGTLMCYHWRQKDTVANGKSTGNLYHG